MKVIINTDFGGFSVDSDVLEELNINLKDDDFRLRTHPTLIKMIEEGYNIDGGAADLKVVTIPDDIDWDIEEYDGVEWVAEAHRIWD